MESIHFSTNNIVGINLCAEEQSNGDLLLCRVFQSANSEKAKAPQLFTIRAEERHGLSEYLMKAHSANLKGTSSETIVRIISDVSDILQVGYVRA